MPDAGDRRPVPGAVAELSTADGAFAARVVGVNKRGCASSADRPGAGARPTR